MLKNSIRISILSLAFLLCSMSVSHAQIQMEVTADTNRMMVGDQQKLVFTVTCDPSITIDKIELDSITAVQGFELSEEQNWVEHTTPMSKILTKEMSFTAFNPGEYNFPEVPYGYSYNGSSKTGKSKSWKLTVLPLNSSGEEIAPNKDIIVEVYFFDKYKWFIYGAGILILLSLVIYFIRKKVLKKNDPKDVFIPKIDPAVFAKSALDKLRQSGLWEQGDHKEFQTALSRILRQYMADAQEIPAMNMTSYEIVQRMGRRRMPDSMIDITDKALNIADLVKFANAQSRNEINYSFIGKVENLIDEAELFRSINENPGI